MHILLTNDDGVQSLGIDELSIAFPEDWKITIVAPAQEQSAQSHALTIQNPLRMQELRSFGKNIKKYAITGTPVDCVKFALDYLLKDDMPDIVISGINNGYNLGSDVLYSGTVSAAMEGMFFGIPSLALSVKRYSSARGHEIIPFIIEFIEHVFSKNQFKGLINMNFPLTGPCNWSQVRVVDQGVQRYVNIIEKQEDRRGFSYYWIGGDQCYDKEETPTDVGIIEDGFITVNALTWKQTDFKGLADLSIMVGEQQ